MRVPKQGSQARVVGESLRQLCLELGEGAKLPSFRDLKTKHNVSAATLNTALEWLEAEEHLKRHHGSGMYVSEAGRQSRIGVIIDPSFFLSFNNSPFWSILLREIINQGAERGERVDLHLTSLPGDTIPPHLEEYLQQSSVRGLIAIGIEQPAFEAVESYNPCIASFAGFGRARVRYILKKFLHLAGVAAGNLGVERVVGWSDYDTEEHPFQERWATYAGDIPFELIGAGQTATKPSLREPYNSVERGFEFARTWSPCPKTAVFSPDDMLSQGFLMGMDDRGFEPGQDYHLITHSNAGSPVLLGWHRKITRLEMSPKESASALLHLVGTLASLKSEGKQAVYTVHELEIRVIGPETPPSGTIAKTRWTPPS